MSWLSKTFKKVTGAVKKVVKGVGTILGVGGGSSTPEVQNIDVTPQVTQVTDVSSKDTKADTTSSDAKKKRRKGFMSTQKNTILGSSNDDTLG